MNPGQACIIGRQQYVQQLVPIPYFHAGYGLNTCLFAQLYKTPGVAGSIDIGNGQSRYALIHGGFYQFFGGKSAIAEAEICFTIDVHRRVKMLKNLAKSNKNFYFHRQEIEAREVELRNLKRKDRVKK